MKIGGDIPLVAVGRMIVPVPGAVVRIGVVDFGSSIVGVITVGTMTVGSSIDGAITVGIMTGGSSGVFSGGLII